jgi:hypothetical protein
MLISLVALDTYAPLSQRARAALAGDDAVNASTAGASPRALPAERWASEEALHRANVGLIAAEAPPGVIALHFPNGGQAQPGRGRETQGPGTIAGAPDLLIIVAGRAYGLELKTAAGRLSKEQKSTAQRFVRAGSQYGVACSVAGVREILRRWGAIPNG